MSEETKTDYITVDDSPPSGVVRVAARNVIFWGSMFAAEAAAHLTFGGSWVIDVMILAALVFYTIGQLRQMAGTSVKMTRAELKLWVDAGMPANVKSWREVRK